MASFLIDDTMMKQGLNLKGSELLVFAFISSFSKKGLTMYESEQSMSEHFPYSRAQIGKTLCSLVAKEFIIRSEGKHPHRQSYDYSVNFTKVQEILASRCEESLQQDANKTDTQMPKNFAASGEESSHNNISDKKVNNERDNKRLRSPFNYILLNTRWDMLIEEERWKGKSNNALQVPYELLSRYDPPVALEMINYSLSNQYRDIYEPKKEMIDKARNNASSFYEKETRARIPKCRRMLEGLEKLAPEELRPYLPSVSHCIISERKARISCTEAVSRWIEANSKITFPLLKSWTMGLNLEYRTPVGKM